MDKDEKERLANEILNGPNLDQALGGISVLLGRQPYDWDVKAAFVPLIMLIFEAVIAMDEDADDYRT